MYIHAADELIDDIQPLMIIQPCSKSYLKMEKILFKYKSAVLFS